MYESQVLALWCQMNPSLRIGDWLWAESKVKQGAGFSDLGGLAPNAKAQQLWRDLPKSLGDIETRLIGLMNDRVRICYPGHEDYPISYWGLHRPPLCLLLKGDSTRLRSSGLAVVGSRNLHELSHRWMESHLSNFLSEYPCTIFSGGARGADQQAHRIALRKGCPTVVFLPSGFGQLYPRELERWQDAVLQGGGLFVSEYWIDQGMRPFHFRQRNRMIAQSGQLLVVIEARRRSGSIMTAGLAAEQGREVAVVPGHPELVQMQGNIELIRAGAQLLADYEDLKCLWLSMSQTQIIDANI